MKRNYITLLILSVVIILGVVTRFYKLGSAPLGLDSDEAGQGYSAYSILRTGKDEFGKAWPILFRSSGDFKTPVYTYLLVPVIKVFGLNSFSVRLTSAIFSILTIPVLYLLVIRLSKNRSLALITSMLLAISPWANLFGRTGYEATVALFFFLFGCLVFYQGLEKPWYLSLSAILFAIAIPAYHSERIVIPLMLLVLFFRHKKVLLSKSYLKYLITGGIVAFVILLPTLSVARTPGFFARVSDLNIFTVKVPAGYLSNYSGILSPIVNNKKILSIHEFASLYLSYFSPRFMFVLGDSGPRSSYPELSTFFVWEFPFYIYGLYLIIRKNDLGELSFFTIIFLLIAPITAALTRDPYSSTRALQMVVPLIIIIALGIGETIKKFKNKRIFLVTSYLAFFILILYSLLKLYSSAIILDVYYREVAWEYGWQPIANTIQTLKPNLPIIVDSSRNVGWIQLAFFLKTDPFLYQKQNFEVLPSEYYTNMKQNATKYISDNIVWRGIDWQRDLLIKQYLIGDSLAISDQQIKEHNLTLVKDVFFPDGSLDLRIVKTNPKLLPSK